MSTLEKIIRPFQSRDVSPLRLAPGKDAEEVPNVVLAIGKIGAVKTLTGSDSSSLSSYMVSESKETSRTTETKTIKNPDDESQSVDVEDVKSLRTKGVNGQEHVSKYKPSNK